MQVIRLLAVVFGVVVATAAEKNSFNDGWRFLTGPAEGAETTAFDDSGWREVRVPHDWAIEGPFDVKYNARSGGLPIHGTGWYRKRFEIPEDQRGKRVAIEFDGAMYDAHVWVNGHFAGHRPFGYVGFEFDVTRYLNTDGGNVIAVRLQPEDLSSRWYPGAGLYRNVWIRYRQETHVSHWGTTVTTPTVAANSAEVCARTRLEHHGDEPIALRLETRVLDPSGKEVGSASSPVEVQPEETATVTHTMEISEPQRWDLETPRLYTVVSTVLTGGVAVDRTETPFGIRTITYKAGEGFYLNGRHVRLNGVCMHHDLGALGAAVNRRATERQLEIMKEMGVNAIRTSHNPPSPEQLELCDRLGLLVQVEAFDCWQMAKVPNGYNKFFDAWHERDLRDMIRRDRNHPSVIMWSIGNEILEQSKKDGWKLARHLHRICKDEDPTRLTSAGFNYYPASVTNGLAAEVDIPGFNYKPLAYAEVRRQHPEWHVLGSETSSCVSSRGVYHLPIEKYERADDNQVTSYDLIGPVWAYPPDIEFMALEGSPAVIGEFVWTGFDYLGEPTPYGGRDNSTDGYWNDDWPSRSSYFGTVDLCGFPKDRYFLYQSQWRDVREFPMVHVLPHWNWEGSGHERIPVYVYTNASEAELFLNGESLGRKRKGRDKPPLKVDFKNWTAGDYETPYRLRWEVPFQPGELKVVAFEDGKAVAEDVRRTAGPAAAISLVADRETIAGDGSDLSFVTVAVTDKDGVPCPTADDLIRFSVEGSGEIVAVDNGNAASTEPFQASQRKAFSGMALVILRATKNSPGRIKLTATGEGLRPASIVVTSN
ncbi:beta-galactosidase/beta-glucuronidase [Haloferula helveola]|uniref:Beta-galactosidase/beta-glucuronidase n=1 Tax=Haloferula helveola TaxID=490095 RepID=A0ABM7RA16_9BACT|nr:beta-galactosidase/beta-glucuronidase [Haloferula helveola]